MNFLPSTRTRAPSALGMQPSVASSLPLFIQSSISLPIPAISSGVGGVLRSTFFVDTQESHDKNSSSFWMPEHWNHSSGFIHTSNGRHGNRQAARNFSKGKFSRLRRCKRPAKKPSPRQKSERGTDSQRLFARLVLATNGTICPVTGVDAFVTFASHRLLPNFQSGATPLAPAASHRQHGSPFFPPFHWRARCA